MNFDEFRDLTVACLIFRRGGDSLAKDHEPAERGRGPTEPGAVGRALSLGIGAFRLAAHAHDRIGDEVDVLEAAHFVCDAISVLLPVEAVCLELPRQVSREAVCCPDGASGSAPLWRTGDEIQFERDDRRLVRCRVLWSQPRMPDVESGFDLAYAGLMLHALARRVERQLGRVAALVTLSKAERRVADLVALPVAEIVERLGVARSTVDSHRKQIYRKLGVHSKWEAAELIAGAGVGCNAEWSHGPCPRPS